MIDVVPLATYTFVMSVTPGPNNVMVTASGVNFGYRRTLPHILGIAIGCAFQTYLMCLGLGALFRAYPVIQDVLQWTGAAYLLYLAWRLATSGGIGESDSARPMNFREGALFQFVNPKAWVMALTTTTLFLPAGASPWLAGLGIFAVFVVVNIPCVSAWAVFGAGMRRWLNAPRVRLAFNLSMAVLLVATALLMVRGH